MKISQRIAECEKGCRETERCGKYCIFCKEKHYCIKCEAKLQAYKEAQAEIDELKSQLNSHQNPSSRAEGVKIGVKDVKLSAPKEHQVTNQSGDPYTKAEMMELKEKLINKVKSMIQMGSNEGIRIVDYDDLLEVIEQTFQEKKE